MKPAIRLLAATGVASAALMLLWRLCEPGVADLARTVRRGRPAPGDGLDHLVSDVAACVAMAAALAVVALAAQTVAAEVSRRRAGLAAPRVPQRFGRFRHAVLVACGLAVGLAGPAVSAHPAEHQHGSCAHRCDPPGALPLPPLPAASAAAPTGQPRPVPGVVVRPGDCLWSIAEGLAPHADDGEVAELVQHLVRLNPGALRADPDLIFPGTHLDTPGGNR